MTEKFTYTAVADGDRASEANLIEPLRRADRVLSDRADAIDDLAAVLAGAVESTHVEHARILRKIARLTDIAAASAGATRANYLSSVLLGFDEDCPYVAAESTAVIDRQAGTVTSSGALERIPVPNVQAIRAPAVAVQPSYIRAGMDGGADFRNVFLGDEAHWRYRVVIDADEAAITFALNLPEYLGPGATAHTVILRTPDPGYRISARYDAGGTWRSFALADPIVLWQKALVADAPFARAEITLASNRPVRRIGGNEFLFALSSIGFYRARAGADATLVLADVPVPAHARLFDVRTRNAGGGRVSWTLPNGASVGDGVFVPLEGADASVLAGLSEIATDGAATKLVALPAEPALLSVRAGRGCIRELAEDTTMSAATAEVALAFTDGVAEFTAGDLGAGDLAIVNVTDLVVDDGAVGAGAWRWVRATDSSGAQLIRVELTYGFIGDIARATTGSVRVAYRTTTAPLVTYAFYVAERARDADLAIYSSSASDVIVPRYTVYDAAGAHDIGALDEFRSGSICRVMFSCRGIPTASLLGHPFYAFPDPLARRSLVDVKASLAHGYALDGGHGVWVNAARGATLLRNGVTVDERDLAETTEIVYLAAGDSPRSLTIRGVLSGDPPPVVDAVTIRYYGDASAQ